MRGSHLVYHQFHLFSRSISSRQAGKIIDILTSFLRLICWQRNQLEEFKALVLMPQHGCTTNAICYPKFSSMPAAASNANPANRPFNRDPLSLAKTSPVSKPTAGNRSALPLLHTLVKYSQVFPTSFSLLLWNGAEWVTDLQGQL